MWLALDGDGPLYRQAYRALRAAILDGRLSPGERLPYDPYFSWSGNARYEAPIKDA